MFRSADWTRTAVAGALALGVTLPWGAAASADTEKPSPYVRPTPGAQQVATAPVVEISAPVLSLRFTVSSLDGSFRDTDAGDRRKVTLAADVLFAFDEASLTGKARSRLRQAAKIIRQHAIGTVHIHGYTDSKGSQSYNLRLSRRRAEAVEKALKKFFENSSVPLATEGHGEANPVAPNQKDGEDNPKGRAKNRRVEITFPQ